MPRAVDDLADDIRALSSEDKSELLLALMAELDAPSSGELSALVKELSDSVRGTNQALDSAIARLDSLDDVIERGRAEIRESVGKTAEHWPFPI